MGRFVSDAGGAGEPGEAGHGSSQLQDENAKSVYKVGLPPRRRLLSEFKETVKETLFHDDPLRPFKDQPKRKKIILGLRAFFPILDWGRRYDLNKFKGDLIAGLTIASLCIPQVIIIIIIIHVNSA